jgi:hypothetical protein
MAGIKLIEVWIIEKQGINLLNVQKPGLTSPMNPALFSGFLSAIQSMAVESIDAITMKDSKIKILPVANPIHFFVVGRASAKEKDQNIQKELEKIRDMFIAEYKQELVDFCGDISIFEPMIPKIQALMK